MKNNCEIKIKMRTILTIKPYCDKVKIVRNKIATVRNLSQLWDIKLELWEKSRSCEISLQLWESHNRDIYNRNFEKQNRSSEIQCWNYEKQSCDCEIYSYSYEKVTIGKYKVAIEKNNSQLWGKSHYCKTKVKFMRNKVAIVRYKARILKISCNCEEKVTIT